jgi:uncharacterized protein (TIGR02996 family)
MADADAFLNAVVADPDADAPRLVFADWLQESGEPVHAGRAEFIRSQVAYARLGPRDSARWALLRREFELLAVHRDAWEGPLRQLGLTGWTFRRGFVEDVVLSGVAFVQSAEELFASAPVRRVKLTAPLGPAARVAARRELARVRALDVCSLQIGDGQGVVLLRSPHLNGLEELLARWNRLGPKSLEALLAAGRFPNLALVDISYNDITGGTVRRVPAEVRRRFTGRFPSGVC